MPRTKLKEGATLRLRAFIQKFQCTIARIAGLIALCAAISMASAAGYPDRPVRLIVPSTAGGGSDATTRVIAAKLAEYLGQQTIVENRPGVSGNLGAEVAARAAPDGYTLVTVFASHTSNVAVMKKVPFDLVRDFAPISLMVTLPNVLVGHPSLPAKTVRELIAFARARPGQLQYATAGVGSNAHLSIALFLNMTGLTMTHIPYKGANLAAFDVLAGNVPLLMGNILVSLPQIRSGRLRAFGVTSVARSSAAPDIPTIAEAGLPGYEAAQWYGLLAPAGTPREIVIRLHAGVVRALQDPAVRKRFVDDGAEPTPSATPEEFAALIQAEIAKWAKVVKAAGIQPE